ncbi:MAG: T9SS type A sorting domain-containing protein [Vicingus serpentipes]|nr:T9SS type A sorting domain-containing protein [Vicingus serpentipes]
MKNTFIIVGLLFTHFLVFATNYHVGPSQTYTTISAAPIELLQAGDTIFIHYKATPYSDKFVIGATGTASQPVVVYGIANGNGDLPMLSGDGATTRTQLDFWSETRGIIKIGGTSTPSDNASHIIIENLDISTARTGYFFDDDNGNNQEYAQNAAAIFIEKGDNITLRNITMHDCGNGLFVASQSSNVLVEYCYLYDNGIESSIYEHNSYTESDGITFQFNKYGRLRTNCLGNNLKDRSKGTVIRYNWIEGGNRQLDLVDSDYASYYNDPKYNSTYVYNNVLVEMPGEGNRQIVHYGGDGGNENYYRKGTLYFYNNTVASYLPGNNTLFRLSSTGESVDARNNLLYALATSGSFEISSDAKGVVNLQNNWIKSGWIASIASAGGVVNDVSGNITGTAPGVVDLNGMDFNIAAGSPLINAATSSLGVTAVLEPKYEFTTDSTYVSRLHFNDIGAFAYHSPVKVNHPPIIPSIAVFPNPTSGQFNILLPVSFKGAMLTVHNSLGQVVWSQELDGNTIQSVAIEGELGVYWVKVEQNGKPLLTSKIIKY